MAELFMECEEEELEPWQQKSRPIVVDDDDDDDEPIFVGEILSSKPASTYILNRASPGGTRLGLPNGAPPQRGAVPASPAGFQPASRSAASTLAVQPQPRAGSISGAAQLLQRPLSGCPSPQEAAKSGASLSQPVGRPATAPALSRNLNIPVLAQSASRPVATVTAQPVMLNRGTPSNASGIAFGLRQNPGGPQCQSGSPLNTTGLPKRPSTSDGSSISPKKAKASETGSGSESPGLLLSSVDPSLLQKGATSSSNKNGAPFPQACPKCNIHFNLLEPLKNHIKYCCPEMAPAFLGGAPSECAGSPPGSAESESGKLIMLVNDFYYGQHEGNLQQVRQEQKTYTTYKCASCMKLLKSNIRFMNHMKHHLELEKQNSESWESHTTCQHCYRQFPTPFQLQCHIESTHTPHESSTICKICELSFETEQVLLQHMKDNHKPGEMPYVCQVCSYRSSAFSDVEKHFRTVHENTKSLLCPFCLKVIKIGLPYMHHFMRHQKKGVHRCTKCRLQFLTGKEKMDHKSQHHRTFKKPPQLEGLPPGTKVTIRASVGSLLPAAVAPPAVGANAPLAVPLSPVAQATGVTKSFYKGSTSKAKAKGKLLGLQKTQSSGGGGGSSSSSSSSSSAGAGTGTGSSRKTTKIANTVLNNLRCPDIQKCIECYSDIRTFASHFPAYVRCGLCRYSTSCSKAYANHMMSFHSARQSKRFWIYKAHSEAPRGTTVVCLHCDFLTDASGMDRMAAHLNDNSTHTCQIIVENVPVASVAAADLADQPSSVLLCTESDGKSQERSRPGSPEAQKDHAVSQSLQVEEVVDSAGKEGDGAASLAETEREKPAEEESRLAPGPPVPAVDPEGSPEEEEERAAPGVPSSEEAPVPMEEESPWPAGEAGAGPGPQGSAEGGVATETLGGRAGEGLPAAGGEASPPPLSSADDPSLVEPPPCSEDPAGEGSALDLVSQGKAGLSDAPCERGPPPLGPGDPSRSGPPAHPSSPGGATKGGEAADPVDQGLVFPAAACEEGNTPLLVLGDPSRPGLSGCPDDDGGSGHEGVACGPFAAPGGGEGLLGEREERPTGPRHSPHLGDALGPAEGEGEGQGLADHGGAFPPGEGGEESPPPAPETPSPPVPSSASAEPAEAARGGDGEAPESDGEEEALSAAEDQGPPALSGQGEAPLLGAEGFPRDPSGEGAQGQTGGQTEACEGSPEPGRGALACSAESPSREKAAPVGDPAGGGQAACVPGGDGKTSCRAPPEEEEEEEEEEAQASEAQAEGSNSDEAELVDVKVVSAEPASEEDARFEQFLSRNAEPASAASDTSEQGSAHLEPLTPSEVLEHEATEILQKGGAAGAAPSSSPGTEAEEPEAAPSSREGSPAPEASAGAPAGGSHDEAS